MTAPSYAVVIPSYNAAASIRRCIRSVFAQSLPPKEVIVVDDCSTDNSVAVFASLTEEFASSAARLIFITLERNSGPAAARNRGMARATATHVAFLDSDDTWMPEKLSVLDKFIRSYDPRIVGHSYTIGDTLPAQVEPHAGAKSRSIGPWLFLVRNVAQTSCVVMRRDSDCLFNERMRYCEDYDLWLRISEAMPLLLIQGAALTRLGRTPLSAGGLSGSRFRMRLGELRVYFRFAMRHFPWRLPMLPLLVVFSMVKHLVSTLRWRFP